MDKDIIDIIKFYVYFFGILTIFAIVGAIFNI